MYGGQIMEIGNTDEIINSPLHPYTKFLLSAVPAPFEKKKEFQVLDDDTVSQGCPFAPRCDAAMKICIQEHCDRFEINENHAAACWMNVREMMREEGSAQ